MVFGVNCLLVKSPMFKQREKLKLKVDKMLQVLVNIYPVPVSIYHAQITQII